MYTFIWLRLFFKLVFNFSFDSKILVIVEWSCILGISYNNWVLRSEKQQKIIKMVWYISFPYAAQFPFKHLHGEFCPVLIHITACWFSLILDIFYVKGPFKCRLFYWYICKYTLPPVQLRQIRSKMCPNAKDVTPWITCECHLQMVFMCNV